MQHLFIHFKNAYNSINRKVLCKASIEVTISRNSIKLIKQTLFNTVHKINFRKTEKHITPVPNPVYTLPMGQPIVSAVELVPGKSDMSLPNEYNRHHY